ncbi:MAG TPA: hypothetical protein VJP02_13520 [Candidatus Sulfotelmatobacter sp.]|nr:hypothetical protein [Candidatus Sulfotelmatobacter sp.]
MRRVLCVLAVAAIWSVAVSAQEAPQTARQALLEMFFSKTSGTFSKHLPAVTLAALEKSGALANLQQYSLLAGQLQTQGTNYQTFETGSVLLSGEDPKTGQKVEVTVENDALRGERDDIELSFQTYKNGQAQRTPFLPRVTFTMKQEARIWKLSEISVTIRLPLADPDLLKAMTENMKARETANVSVTPVSVTPRTQTATSSAGSDAQVLAAMRTILAAEITYATSYPRVGFTCTLSDLDGFGGGEPNEHQAMLINSGLASGKKHGFVFTLSGCGGAPATGFHLSTVPNANTFGRKAFCSDQSGTIRSSDDGNPATCFASGTLVQ